MSIPSLVRRPNPFILSARHQPLQTPRSAQTQVPRPCLLSAWKFPSYMSPLDQMQTPLPCLCPSANWPSQDYPFDSFSLPQPDFASSFHVPQQVSPFLYQYIPEYLRLFLKSPLKMSPLKSVSWPSFFQSFYQMPLNVVPSLQKYCAFPCRIPCTKVPEQRSLLTYSSSPIPWGRSFSIYPLQTLPSAHTSLPLPFFAPFLKSPKYISPVILFLQYPVPCFSPLSQLPQQYSSGEFMTPAPCFMSCDQFPEQQAAPWSQKQVPTPSFWFIDNSPSQISPEANKQMPRPWKQSLLQPPKQTSPVLQTKMP